MARLKLKLWHSVISDCKTCLELSPDNMKAYYYLSHAELALNDCTEALENAKRAHEPCVPLGDKSLAAITAQVLRCKKERWDAMERWRARESSELEVVVLELMKKERDDVRTDAMVNGDKDEIADEWEQKLTQMRAIFEKSRAAEEKRRMVPDWAVDDISFSIMVDPVITKTGKSYERASVMEHLRRHPTDPVTRDPLCPSELRPNLGLKQACDEFLEGDGWAVDW